MGAATKNAIANEHTRRYVEVIWTELLTREGFTCPDERLLCWYRMINQEVIHFLCFHANNPGVPVFLDLEYGAFPLVFQPDYIRTVSSKYGPNLYGFGFVSPLMEKYVTTGPFREDMAVYAPMGGRCGLGILEDKVLPWLEDMQTVESCYQKHRARFTNPNQIEFSFYMPPLSCAMVEYAIYMGDTEAYPCCLEKAKKMTEHYAKSVAGKPQNQEYKKALESWGRVLNVLESGNREEFLQHLEQRKQKTLKWLDKMGIPI